MAETAASTDRERTDYYSRGASFADEINRSNERAARVWMIIAGILAVLLGASIFAIAALAPLKEVELYAVTVNESVGTISVARPLEEGPIREDEAVRESLVAQYVIARETYEPYSSRDRFDLVMLMSASDAARRNENAEASPNSTKGAGGLSAKSFSGLSVRFCGPSFSGMAHAPVEAGCPGMRASSRAVPHRRHVEHLEGGGQAFGNQKVGLRQRPVPP